MRCPKKCSDGYQWDPPDYEWLEHQYLTLGKSKKTIATEIGSGQGTIRRWLEAADVSRDSTDEAPQKFGTGHSTYWTPPSKEWLERRYVILRIPIRVIAHRIGADGSTVRRWLRQLGIPRWTFEEINKYHAQSIVAEKNPRWVGGHSGGYVLESALTELEAAGVPARCALCEKEGQLDIHRQDGDRTNNALENLQYLCRSCHRQLHEDLKRSPRCP